MKETLSEYELAEVFNLLTSGYPPNILLSLQLLRPYYNDKQIRRMIVDNVLKAEFERNFEDFKAYQRANVVPEVVERNIVYHYEKLSKRLKIQYNKIVNKPKEIIKFLDVIDYELCSFFVYDRKVYIPFYLYHEKFRALTGLFLYYEKRISK